MATVSIIAEVKIEITVPDGMNTIDAINEFAAESDYKFGDVTLDNGQQISVRYTEWFNTR